MPPNPPKSRYYDQGGLRALAEALLETFGRRITCSVCEVVSPKFNAFCLNEGGNPTKDGLKRRFFRCRHASQQKQDNDSSCPTLSCEKYIARALETIGWKRTEDCRRDVVTQCRRRELTVLQIEAPIPEPSIAPSGRNRADLTTSDTASRSLKRAGTTRGGDGDDERERKEREPSPPRKRTHRETCPKSNPDRTHPKSTKDLTIEFQRLQDSVLSFGRYLGIVEDGEDQAIDPRRTNPPLPSTIPDSEGDTNNSFAFEPHSPPSASWAFLQSTPTPPGTPSQLRPSPDAWCVKGKEEGVVGSPEVVLIGSSSPHRQETIRRRPPSVFRAFARTVHIKA